jgi:hypothetical protein
MRRLLVASLLVASALGCRERLGPDRLPTVRVRGTVLVNDLPAPQLTVKFNRLVPPEGQAEIYAGQPAAMTDVDGTFAASTYEQGDGVIPGDYAVTFEWLRYNFIQNSYGGPDKLGNKYSDPAKSEIKFTVTGDEEEGGIDLGTIRLGK